jgi:hypothetical protein
VPSRSEWRLHSGRLWRLGDVIDLEIRLLVKATTSIVAMMSMLRSILDADEDNAARAPLLADLQHSADFIRDIARAAGMDATESGASRLVEGLQALKKRHVEDAGQQLRISQTEITDLERNVDYLVMCFHDQLNAKHGLFLTNEEARLYQPNEPLFGKDVFDKFNDSARDISESGKCLALGRNTACVFHLMLAMERALRAMAAKIGANVHDKHGNFDRWSVIVGNVKAAIPTLPKDKQDAWTEAHNLLWGVGKVWRNETMHPAEAYTDQEARDVFGAVKVFMSRLADLV